MTVFSATSELVWNISEIRIGFSPVHTQIISELRWNSHFEMCVSLPMILQVLQDYASLFALQNYASHDLYTKIHSSLSILLGLLHLPCNMKHLGKRPSQSSAMRAK